MADDPDDRDLTPQRIRTPRAAAIAGIAFSLLLTTALLLVRWSIPADPTDAGEWLTNDSKRNAVVVALNLLPFASIAFLWFVGVIRDRIGTREDRFFATVFLGSGLLFVAMLFASAATASGLVMAAGGASGVPSADVWSVGRRGSYTFLVYAMRMAAVFTITTSTIAARLGLLPRWLLALGFATGAVLLVSAGIVPGLELIFPAWVFVLSVHLLRVSAAVPVHGIEPPGLR